MDQLKTLGVAGAAVTAIAGAVTAAGASVDAGVICITVIAVVSLVGRYSDQIAKTLKD